MLVAGPRGCSSCQLNLHACQYLSDSLRSLYPNLDVVFVDNVPDFKELEVLAKLNKFRLPIFYDRKGAFTERNKFPVEKTVQVLLLDKNNKVVLIGNPIKQGKVLATYRKMISGLS